jgi:hypothetical protein
MTCAIILELSDELEPLFWNYLMTIILDELELDELELLEPLSWNYLMNGIS